MARWRFMFSTVMDAVSELGRWNGSGMSKLGLGFFENVALF
jgi:hypothetical protein